DVAALDRIREVLQDPYRSGRFRAGAVRRHLEEVERERNLRRAHQVGEKGKASLEDRDENQILALVISRDARAELAHFRGDLIRRDQSLRDIVGLLRACENGHARSIMSERSGPTAQAARGVPRSDAMCPTAASQQALRGPARATGPRRTSRRRSGA